jgi:hypothetical protein
VLHPDGAVADLPDVHALNEPDTDHPPLWPEQVLTVPVRVQPPVERNARHDERAFACLTVVGLPVGLTLIAAGSRRCNTLRILPAMSAVDVARAYADALDRGDDAAAAELMAEDVELVLPHRSVRGRDTWLELRAQQGTPEHMEERVRDAEFVETTGGVEMRATLVQSWVESGEVANEQPLHVRFAIADDRIGRIEFVPPAAS